MRRNILKPLVQMVLLKSLILSTQSKRKTKDRELNNLQNCSTVGIWHCHVPTPRITPYLICAKGFRKTIQSIERGIAALSFAVALSVYPSYRALPQPLPAESSFEDAPQIMLRPLSSSCFLPPISVSAAMMEDLSAYPLINPPITERSGGWSWRRGDGSDLDLIDRIREFLEAGQIDAALDLIPQIDAEIRRHESLAAVVRAYLEIGQVEQAETLALTIPLAPPAQDFPYAGFDTSREDAIGAIVAHYVDTDDLESALALLEQLDETSRVQQLLNVAFQYQRQNQRATALELIDKALETARSLIASGELPGISPEYARVMNFLLLLQIAGSYEMLEAWENAADVVPDMFTVAQTFSRQDYASLRLLVKAAILYKFTHQNEPAIDILTYVTQSAATLEHPYLQVVILANVADAYTALGESNRALAILPLAQELITVENETPRQNLSAMSVARSYTMLGQYDTAHAVAQAIAPQELQTQVTQAIHCAESSYQGLLIKEKPAQ